MAVSEPADIRAHQGLQGPVREAGMDELQSRDAGAGPSAGAARRGSAVAVLGFTAGLAAAGAALAAVASRHPSHLQDGVLPWWLFAVAFFAASRWDVRVEVRHEAYAFGFAEVPLAIGLFHATPTALVLAYVVGGGLAIASAVRSPRKIAFNVALYAAETGAALALFAALAPRADVTN